MIYGFITPSQELTFKADDDKVAFMCAYIVGEGNTSCIRIDEKGEKVEIPTLLYLNKDHEAFATEYLGEHPSEFTIKNWDKMIECFDSFVGCNLTSREEYDRRVDEIENPDEKQLYIDTYREENPSLLGWENGARYYAQQFRNKKPETDKK